MKFKITIRKGIAYEWSYSSWEKVENISSSFKLYILKCYNKEERFHKTDKMPHNYNIIRIFEGSSREVSELEYELNKKTQYTPKI